jgi:hypothetical protein
MGLAVVLPIYNEEPTIEGIVTGRVLELNRLGTRPMAAFCNEF